MHYFWEGEMDGMVAGHLATAVVLDLAYGEGRVVVTWLELGVRG